MSSQLLKSVLDAILAKIGSVAAVTSTDKSGTITTGGESQVAIAANASRKGGFIQNTSEDYLYVNDGASASTSSAFIVPGGVIELSVNGQVYTGDIHIYGATTGQSFAAKEYT